MNENRKSERKIKNDFNKGQNEPPTPFRQSDLGRQGLVQPEPRCPVSDLSGSVQVSDPDPVRPQLLPDVSRSSPPSQHRRQQQQPKSGHEENEDLSSLQVQAKQKKVIKQL